MCNSAAKSSSGVGSFACVLWFEFYARSLGSCAIPPRRAAAGSVHLHAFCGLNFSYTSVVGVASSAAALWSLLNEVGALVLGRLVLKFESRVLISKAQHLWVSASRCWSTDFGGLGSKISARPWVQRLRTLTYPVRPWVASSRTALGTEAPHGRRAPTPACLGCSVPARPWVQRLRVDRRRCREVPPRLCRPAPYLAPPPAPPRPPAGG